MSKLQALTALRDAISGSAISTDLIQEAFDEQWEQVTCLAAFDGSLDAAKSLHEAVLPGYGWLVQDMRLTDAFGAVVFENALYEVRNTAPARAWLLAILEALIQMETQE